MEGSAPKKQRRGKQSHHHDADLKHALREAEISEIAQEQLLRLGITTVAKLLERKDDLEYSRIENITDVSQKILYQVCLWYGTFLEKNSKQPAWQLHFDQKVFSSFQKNNSPSTKHKVFLPKHLFAVAKTFVHDVDRNGKGGLSEEYAEADIEDMYSWAAATTVHALSGDLRGRCKFDIQEYAVQWFRSIFSSQERDSFVIHGHTQSGKSTLKALVYAICEMTGIPLIVITKGVSESKDLKKKISDHLHGCTHKTSPTGAWWKTDMEMLYVIADTAAQINTAVRRIQQLRAEKPNLSFVVILDECDTMYRTAERSQKTEIAYDNLQALNPSLSISISATPLSAMLTQIHRQGMQNITMLQISTSDDYSGIANLHPLLDGRGESVFLRQGDIVGSEGVQYSCKMKSLQLLRRDKESLFPEDDKLGDGESFDFPSLDDRDFIPCTNRNVMRLYDDALMDTDTRRGVLLLDSTCPRVYVDNNIFEKACCVQNHYRTRGKNIAVIIATGKGIFVRRPGFEQGRFTKKTMSDVIQSLDEKYGLEMPIFVFGYSKMRRCISYRSNERVPTHMVLMLGQGQSNANFVQAIGRATFNGLEVLKQNGHHFPKILTNQDDFLMAQKYGKYMDEVHVKQKNGDTALQALMGTNERFSSEANFLQHSNRKTGQDKTLCSLLPGQGAFRESSSSESASKKKHYWDNSLVQNVMWTLSHLCNESLAKAFTAKEILAMHDDTFQYRGSHASDDNNFNFKMGDLRSVLRKLYDDVVIFKADKDEEGKTLWGVHVKKLHELLNPWYKTSQS